MSLIQEALKRKLEEQQGTSSVGVPQPAPTPQKSRHASSKGGVFGRVLGFGLALLLMVAVAVALFYLAAKNWNWRDAVAEARTDVGDARQKLEARIQEMQVAQKAEEPAPVASGGGSMPGIQPLAQVQGRVAEMKERVVDYEAEHAEVVTSATPPAPAKAAGPAVAKPEVERADEASASVLGFFKRDDGARKPGPWPRITVNGILASGRQGGGAAMINNRVVGVNELVEGARVLDVQAKGVLLEYKGETRLLLAGQSSEE